MDFWIASVTLFFLLPTSLEGLKCQTCLPDKQCCQHTCSSSFDDACATISAAGVITRQCVASSSCGRTGTVQIGGQTIQATAQCCYSDNCNAPPSGAGGVCSSNLKCWACAPDEPCTLNNCASQYDTCWTLEASGYDISARQCGIRDSAVCGKHTTVEGVRVRVSCCDFDGCNSGTNKILLNAMIMVMMTLASTIINF